MSSEEGFDFPSDAWTAAFKDAVNGNERYREAGKPWIHGAVAMVVSADPALGLEHDMGMILDVDQGVCRGTSLVKGMDAVAETPFVIVAPYARWRQVIEGELDPIKGMMEGKLKLTQGNLPIMIRYVESSRELVTSAAHVPTRFRG